MNKITPYISLAFITLVFSSCVSNLTSTNASISSPVPVSDEDRVIAERIYALVNNERALVSQRALRGHNGLNHLAQRHSLYMGSSLGSVYHFGSENRAQYAYLKHSIENLSEMTYITANGSEDPALEAVEAWSSSPDHRNKMLQSWDVTGIGVSTNAAGETYITICLGAKPIGTPRSVRPIGW